jgi:dTMP kinase
MYLLGEKSSYVWGQNIYKRRYDMKKGLLVVFEGLDGAGKTTQINLLKDWFEKNNKIVYNTKQPTDFYRKDKRVRNYLDKGIVPNMYSIALLAAADRTYQNEAEIKPILSKGINIISDRYLYSSLAFFKARGIEYEEIIRLNKNIEKPDVVIFLDVKPKKALERIKIRDGENIKFEEKDDNTFIQVRNNFLEVLPKDTLIIDSSKSIEEIHKIIINHIENMKEK